MRQSKLLEAVRNTLSGGLIRAREQSKAQEGDTWHKSAYKAGYLEALVVDTLQMLADRKHK